LIIGSIGMGTEGPHPTVVVVGGDGAEVMEPAVDGPSKETNDFRRTISLTGIEGVKVVGDPKAQRMEELEDSFPPTYKENSPKELLALEYVANFRRQLLELYADRKPFLLTPFNECRVPVCGLSWLPPPL
jgi:hypothetical protein